MQKKRNWKEYNEKLVRRGEIYLSLDFLENWDEELDKMNKGKVGRSYIYPQTFMQFSSFPTCSFPSIETDGRILEETLRIYTQVKGG